MRTITLLLMLAVASVCLAEDAENAKIIAAVDHAYVHGVHIDADAEKMRAGMHDQFIMFVIGNDGTVSQVTRDAWIERLKTAKPNANIRADIKVLDRAGNAAVAKVDLFRDGKQIFTDYISLYRVNGEWKLLGKIYQRHQP